MNQAGKSHAVRLKQKNNKCDTTAQVNRLINYFEFVTDRNRSERTTDLSNRLHNTECFYGMRYAEGHFPLGDTCGIQLHLTTHLKVGTESE